MVGLAITLSNASLTTAVAGNRELRAAAGESVAKLVSGNRLFNAAADVSATAIAVNLQAQSAGFRQAADNASRGASLLETAAAGLDQIQSAIDSLQALATQAANPSLLQADRAQLQKQFSDTLASIDTIASGTTFGGASLLTGFSSRFSIGQGTGDTISVTIDSATKAALFSGATSTIDSVAHATAASTAVTDAGNNLQTISRYVEGVREGFSAAAESFAQSFGGNARAHSAVADTDIPAEQATEASLALKLDSSTAVVAQASRLQPTLLKLIHSTSTPPKTEKPASNDAAPEATPVAAPATDTTTATATDAAA
jgi:flagellin